MGKRIAVFKLQHVNRYLPGDDMYSASDDANKQTLQRQGVPYASCLPDSVGCILCFCGKSCPHGLGGSSGYRYAYLRRYSDNTEL